MRARTSIARGRHQLGRAGPSRGVMRSLSTFVIVKPDSWSAAMNDALAPGTSLIVTPCIHHLDAPQHVTRRNTVVLGLGMATLVPGNRVSAIIVDDVDGITHAGLLVDASPPNSPRLVQVGHIGSSARHSSNPTFLSDVFVRVGGVGSERAAQPRSQKCGGSMPSERRYT